jgi:RecA-family ATPase
MKRTDLNDHRAAGRIIDPDGPPLSRQVQPVAEPSAVANDPGRWGDWSAVPIEWLAEPPPPRQWLLQYPRHERGNTKDWAGMLPRGKVGILAGAGGMGKTHAITSLALAVATGGLWLDTYRAPEKGRVLLLMGEEDPGEVQRRLYYAAQRLPRDARDAAAARIVAIPLAGHSTLALSGGEPAQMTNAATELVRRVRAEHEAGRGFALIVLDPFARFAGENSELDNSAATRFVQVIEALAGEGCGSPTVLVVHHTSQAARQTSTNDATAIRGVTGLTDAVRWCALMGKVAGCDDPAVVAIEVVKSNYAPHPPALVLRREDGGRLRAETSAEAQQRRAAAELAAAERARKKGKPADQYGSDDA